MALKRQPSPTDDDFERVAEAIINTDDFNLIQDRNSFDKEYDDYFENSTEWKKNRDFRDAVFKNALKLKPKISSDKLFTEAGGKNLTQDRKTNAKIIVTSKQEYIDKGASRVDLKGFDTIPRKSRKREFNKIGRINNKIVFSSEYPSFKLKTKTGNPESVITRFRDKKGRFVKI